MGDDGGMRDLCARLLFVRHPKAVNNDDFGKTIQQMFSLVDVCFFELI